MLFTVCALFSCAQHGKLALLIYEFYLTICSSDLYGLRCIKLSCTKTASLGIKGFTYYFKLDLVSPSCCVVCLLFNFPGENNGNLDN